MAVPEPDHLLSEEEKRRIRAEVRFALLAAKEARSGEKKGALGRLLDYLSNGFVLLVVGSLITAFLVPQFQRKNERRSQEAALMQECLTQYLLYTNSLWQEYYAVLPLTQQVEIDQPTYLLYLNKIAEIKLKRYDAYERIQALAVVFRNSAGKPGETEIEASLKRYQVDLNSASAAIDKWLTGLYCTPFERDRSPCGSFDARFDPYREHLHIKERVVQVGNADKEAVAARIVARITQR